MATYDDILRSLPGEVRAQYMESSKRMTPTNLRMQFGLQNPLAEEQRVPRTNASQSVHRLAEDAMQAWQDIHTAHWSSVADQTADKRTAYLRSAQFAKKQLQRIEADHTAALEGIEEKAKYLATVLGNARKPPNNYGEAMIDAEMRAMFRAEPNPDKAMALARAHPRAIATAPPAALGIGEETHSQYVRQYLQQVEPDNLADQDDLREALGQLQTATAALKKEANALIDFDAAARMEKFAGWIPPQRDAA
ncbi:MAG: hypothetical protein WC100_16910 [Sterolibacterium sp.]